LSHARNRHSILWLELLVLRLFLHVNTLRYEVLHFRSEAAHTFPCCSEQPSRFLLHGSIELLAAEESMVDSVHYRTDAALENR